ncbi:hypothetical protein DRH27_02805 [Candidatus Falkowbacteria bacterium]|nr:MAG: hypothetical protein DRH27_02805 [Candidatus Falkowbacteria bacterium]
MPITSNRNEVKAWFECGGKKFYSKSRLERRYASLLQVLKRGKQIADWQYEAFSFKFYPPFIPKQFKGKITGVRQYKPDFKITNLDGSIEWHETKGHLDNRDKTKLRCFNKYYPDEKLVFVVCGLPKGKTPKSRNRLRNILTLKKIVYRIYDVRDDFKKLGFI